jgi:hypothetical protein
LAGVIVFGLSYKYGQYSHNSQKTQFLRKKEADAAAKEQQYTDRIAELTKENNALKGVGNAFFFFFVFLFSKPNTARSLNCIGTRHIIVVPASETVAVVSSVSQTDDDIIGLWVDVRFAFAIVDNCSHVNVVFFSSEKALKSSSSSHH